jgi:hypothetical protein
MGGHNTTRTGDKMETQFYTIDRNVMPQRITVVGVEQEEGRLARCRQILDDGSINPKYTEKVEEIAALKSNFVAWQACKDWAATKGYKLNTGRIKTAEGYAEPLTIFVRKDASGKLAGYAKLRSIWTNYVDSQQVTA